MLVYTDFATQHISQVLRIFHFPSVYANFHVIMLALLLPGESFFCEYVAFE
ncbi:hypothetical protein ACJX0J_013429, partial [Zea mays]